MNKQTILSAYFKARERHVLSVFFSETASQEDLNSGFAEYFLRVKRQVETFAARLAVVQPTKRNALSDDTPLSAEAMMKLGAQKMGGRFVVYTEWWFCERNFIWDVPNLKIGTSSGEVTADGVRTVGDLKSLYRMLTDRELEVKR
jgi:hypothetical protein